MNPNSVLALVAATFSAALAVAAVCRGRRSLATWCFSVGMVTFALESFFGAMWLDASIPERAAFWAGLTFVMKSFLPGIWLCFGFTYSRGGSRGFPLRSRFLVLAALLVSVGVSLLFREQLAPVYPLSGATWWIRSHAAAKILNGSLLLTTVLVLMNLEKTFRSAVGTMRWRIKFVVLGLGIVFGARIYTLSQGLLFSGAVQPFTDLDTAALLIGSAFGYLLRLVRPLLRDHLRANAVSLATPFAAYLAGEAAHVSGVRSTKSMSILRMLFCALP